MPNAPRTAAAAALIAAAALAAPAYAQTAPAPTLPDSARPESIARTAKTPPPRGLEGGAGVGVVRHAREYAAVDNAARLPGFTRLDGALFAALGRGARAQLNVENPLDRRYWASAQGNNDLMPGAPRLVRLTPATGAP